MNDKQITMDGIQFYTGLVAGINNLLEYKNKLDEINVFPVPDGDTGTNLLLTMRAGLETCAEASAADLGQSCDKLSDGLFWGARGNSGVILSQFFKGFSAALDGLSGGRPSDLSQALAQASNAAYQAVGQPVWKMLGGRARRKMQMYVHAGGTTPADYARNWAKAKDEGWTAAKGGFLRPRGLVVDPSRDVRDALARLKAVREAVGPDFRILIDLHGFPTPPMAVEFCAGAEPYHPYFVEEATQIEDVDELAHLRSKTRVPLATGERLLSRWEFRQVIEKQAVSLLQPDVAHCGGPSELKRIANYAEVYYQHILPHCAIGPVAFSASMQVDAVVPNFLAQEQIDQGLGGGLFVDDWVVEDGHIDLPTKPGLGFEIDEQAVQVTVDEYREELGGEYFYETDGSVADW